MRTGGQVLADGLVAHGAEFAFCVPGESYLELLDGLYEHRGALRIVNCRHEGAAANAADAYGKLTGRPGLCFVTRGPGATHAAAGIHTARQDSTPLLMLVGQVARDERGRESFQELDYEAVFGPMAKWAFELDDPARIPEVLARAYREATSGRPGPVVLALPEDVLAAETDVPDAPRYRAVRPSPSPEALAGLRARLERAERPFVLVGGGPWDAEAA
jgi:acetolactate synthase I/II/III large subunit